MIRAEYVLDEDCQSVRSANGVGRDSAASERLDNGIALYQHGDLDSARRVFEEVLAGSPSNWRAYYFLGLIHNRCERYGRAEAYLNRSLRYAPADKTRRSLIYIALAVSFEQRNDLSRAKLKYLTALNLNPQSPEAREALKRLEPLKRRKH